MSDNFPCGFLNVLKPPGMSSHTVVAKMRRILGKGKIGHLGTLDPGASGVLPLALGSATRAINYLPEAKKGYIAELIFGLESETLDTLGHNIVRHPVPDITFEQLEEVCSKYRGTIMQVPPSVSALHVDGVRSYELVRQGQAVELPPRPAHYYSVQLQELKREQGELKAFINVECGPGTYIRALIRDIGQAFSCGACMSFLIRTQSGIFTLENAVTLEELEREGISHYLLSVGDTLQHYGLETVEVHPQRNNYERNQALTIAELNVRWKDRQVFILRDRETKSLFGLGRLDLRLRHLNIERLFFLPDSPNITTKR